MSAAAPSQGTRRPEARGILPLEGITVVTLEHAIAGPFCTRQLADLGARVIKIERPGSGDFARGYDERVRGLASHFVWTNRSKESLTLDVKNPRARTVLARLIERADVFLQNLAPGAADRLGLGAQTLRERKPALIWCGISGYGPSGPYAEKKAYDLLVQCETGMLSVTGTPDARITSCRRGTTSTMARHFVGFAELAAEGFDVHVDGAFEDDGVFADGGVHELGAGEGAAGLAEQAFQ